MNLKLHRTLFKSMIFLFSLTTEYVISLGHNGIFLCSNVEVNYRLLWHSLYHLTR